LIQVPSQVPLSGPSGVETLVGVGVGVAVTVGVGVTVSAGVAVSVGVAVVAGPAHGFQSPHPVSPASRANPIATAATTRASVRALPNMRAL
jgi:hypothetical protein